MDFFFFALCFLSARNDIGEIRNMKNYVDTLEVRSKIGRFDTCNGNAKLARAFPGVTESTV